MTPPTLTTQRLILTAPTVALFEQHLATVADPRIYTRVGTGSLQSRAEVWRRYCQGAGFWPMLGYGYWAVLDRASGAMIGYGGLARFERGLPALDGVAEAGWTFNATWWGRGLATEFVREALRWADEQRLPMVRCVIAPDNMASIAVAERVGFGGATPVEIDGWQAVLYSRGMR